MLVVSNTSPIANLGAIGRLELLNQQFGALLIPVAVRQELLKHPDQRALESINSAIQVGWLQVTQLEPTPWLALLRDQVDLGEAEAIALAVERQADIVLIDEMEGRRLALTAGLSVTGVLGILLKAKHVGSIQAVGPEIEKLRSHAHFFVSPKLEAQVLASAGE